MMCCLMIAAAHVRHGKYKYVTMPFMEMREPVCSYYLP
jgi:hypothetical protein